jgi:hypothetical protein
MRHRVGRWLRVLLLVAGVLLIAWLPISFFVTGFIRVNARTVYAGNGCLSITYGFSREREAEHFPLLTRDGAATRASPPASSSALDPTPPPVLHDFDSGIHLNERIYFSSAVRSDVLWPSLNRIKGYQLVLPLWILAAICLAWPTTAFVARRRKRQRGFLVELEGG